jgi:PDZ domain-containing protein
MKRRGVVAIAGTLVTICLGAAVAFCPLPYVILEPGPTVDTLGSSDGKPVITVTGREPSTSAGQLRLTTVEVDLDIDLPEAVKSWFDRDRALVPRDVIFPPGQTTQQVDRQDAEQFTSSQSSAELVAGRELGYPAKPQIIAVTSGGPASGQLQVGDVITAVGGQPVDTAQKVADLAGPAAAGTRLTIAYTRSGRAGTATIASTGGAGGLGVQIEQKSQAPFTVNIDLDRIGGPSAGLMFTLGIIDKLTPADLTGGRVIAGTGTVNDSGVVGPIGGIPQKLVGAKEAGAQLFLVPAANCAEALRNSVPGLPMAKVGTVDEALTALRTYVAGGTPTPCA